MQIDVLAGLVNDAVNDAPPDGMLGACSNDYAPYYHLVYLLAEHMAPCNVVELGVAHGRFLQCASMASADNTIIGVDVVYYPELDGVLSARSNIVFVNKPSVPVPDEISSMLVTIDVLHIDTVHTCAQVMSEFGAYKDLLSDGAVVMFDDLRSAKDLVGFFDGLPYPKIREDKLHTALGYGVMVYTR